MGNVFKEAFERAKGLKVPKANTRTVQVILGVVNLFFSGWGTIIGGIIDGALADVLVGLVQFVLTFIILGWIWSILWGVLMIAGKD